MRNNKGFTLIELIAVIAIIGVISIIAIFSVNKIQQNSIEKNFELTKKRIEIAGEKYYYDTGLYNFNVDALIKRGLIEADKDGQLFDPQNKNNVLNNSLIIIDEITKKATLYIDREYNYNNSNILIYNEDDTLYEEKWTNKDITLKAVLKDQNNNDILDNVQYSWIIVSSPGEESKDQDFTISVNDNELYNEAVMVTIKHDNISYTRKFNVKIDKIAPTCTNIINKCHKDDNENVILDEAINSGEWTKTYVNVKPTCTDSESGCDNVKTTVTTRGATTNHTDYLKNSFRVQASGESTVTFTIYDKAGNPATCSTVEVKRDTTPPTCTLSMSGTTGISLTRSDTGGSGLASYGIGGYNSTASKTLSSSGTYTGYVKDNAGNENTCSINVTYSDCASGQNTCRSEYVTDYSTCVSWGTDYDNCYNTGFLNHAECTSSGWYWYNNRCCRSKKSVCNQYRVYVDYCYYGSNTCKAGYKKA